MVLTDAELSEEFIWSTQILVDRLTVQVADLGCWWWVLVLRWCVKFLSGRPLPLLMGPDLVGGSSRCGVVWGI